jgi:CPA1 family monovalent cation:H+ antiporter
LAGDPSSVAELVRQGLTALLADEPVERDAGNATRAARNGRLRGTLQVARQAVLAMGASNEIGDDAVHQVEEELDCLEIGGGRRGE